MGRVLPSAGLSRGSTYSLPLNIAHSRLNHSKQRGSLFLQGRTQHPTLPEPLGVPTREPLVKADYLDPKLLGNLGLRQVRVSKHRLRDPRRRWIGGKNRGRC